MLVQNVLSGVWVFKCKHMVALKRHIFNCLAMCLLLSSCNQTDAPDCLKSAGKQLERPRIIHFKNDFNSIEVRQNIAVRLVPDTACFVLLYGRENILAKLRVQLQGQNLIIQNDNTCNWVRSYQHVPMAEVHVTSLRALRLFGYGPVQSVDTLKGHALDVLHYGATPLDLKLSYYSLFYDGDHVATARLSGNLQVLYFSTQKLNQLAGKELYTRVAQGTHKSERDAIFNCSDTLRVNMLNTGNLIVASGTPVVQQQGKGPGSVIMLK